MNVLNAVRHFACLMAVATTGVLVNHAQAVNRYFDINGTITGSGVADGGSYSWESAFWNANVSAGTGTTTAWTEGDFPRFSAGTDGAGKTYTITASSNHTIAGMFLNNSGGSVNINAGAGVVLSIASGLQGFFVGTPATQNLKINAPLGGVDATSAIQWSGTSGSLYLYGVNTFQGGVSLNTVAGLNFNNNSSFGTGPISWNVATQVLAAPDAAAAINIGNAMSTRAASTLVLASFNGQTVKWSGNWTLAAAGTSALDLRSSAANTEISGNISGADSASALTLTNAGAGTATLKLSGSNSYQGATTIANDVLSVSNVGVSGSNSNIGKNGTINFGATTTTGTLLYTGTGETSNKVLNLAGTTGGGVIDQSGTGLLKFTSNLTATGADKKTLTLQGSTAGAGEISGAIVDNSSVNKTSVTKAGTNTWTLSGASTYSGNTTVSGGTLFANNTTGSATGTGNISVASGATFGGTGAVSGSVSVNGTLAPGASIQSLASGAITFNAGSKFKYELNTSLITADLMDSSGGVTLATTGAGVALSASDLASGFIDGGTRFTMIAYNGALTGTFAGIPDLSYLPIGAHTFRIRYHDTLPGVNTFLGDNLADNTGFVTLTAVPELSSFLTMGLIACCVLGAIRLGKRFGFKAFCL